MSNVKTQVGKVALVTGASSGIGKSSVLDLLERGYKVYAVARRVEAMKELEAKGAELRKVDLTQPGEIKALVDGIEKEDGRLDVLVNNAGYGFYGAVEEVPMQAARDQMEVNLFAPAQLIQSFLPLMRRQKSGRIINITSIGGKLWSPFGAWYHASKFGLEGFSDVLRNEVKHLGIQVVVVEPGGVKTEWGDIAFDNMLKTSGKGAYGELAQKLYQFAKKPDLQKMYAEPEAIAKVIGLAATVKNPKARYVAPFSGKVMLFFRWIMSDSVFDWFWRKLVGLPEAA